MTVTLYGLKNCDSCRKATKALKAQGAEVALHDVRADGLTPALVKEFAEAVGLDKLVNRKSTTWRGLSDEDRAKADGAGAAELLVEHPSLMKRPVVRIGETLTIGADPAAEAAWGRELSKK